MTWYKVWTFDHSAPVILVKAEDEPSALKKIQESNGSYNQIEEYTPAKKKKAKRGFKRKGIL